MWNYTEEKQTDTNQRCCGHFSGFDVRNITELFFKKKIEIQTWHDVDIVMSQQQDRAQTPAWLFLCEASRLPFKQLFPQMLRIPRTKSQ